MNVLLTFTGFHDPYSKGLISEEEHPGPILSILSAREFHRIYLFDTPNTTERTQTTRSAIQQLHPASKVTILSLDLDDPTNYSQILQGLRHHFPEILKVHLQDNLFIAVASGTPQMHACWLMLSAAGEIPARILHVRPPHFVTAQQPMVTEIDPASAEFPIIRFSRRTAQEQISDATDYQTVAAQIGIVGDHPSMHELLEKAARLANSNVPILIYGETGTGKELLARFLHRLSLRPAEKFVPVNCAALPPDLVESLLFGHKKGAFTSAHSDQIGKFSLADKGTLFLDELGELPPNAQAKLLRVIQDGCVEPIGASKPHRVDTRIIAATNKDLRQIIQEKKFREDLYYRLVVGELHVPPLRDRRSDISKMALSILDRINASLRYPKRLSVAALERLQAYSWPGNVRELENTLERSVRLCPHEVLAADDLMISQPAVQADPLAVLPDPAEGFAVNDYLESARKQLFMRALQITGGNQSQAARLLGVTPQAVHKFLRHGDD